MSINRVSSGFLTQQSVNFLQNNLMILSKIQERLSSGKNINRPSDDPVGLTRILDLANTLGADQRYAKNIEDALAETNTADSAMTSIVTIIHRAQELATQGATETNNQNGRDAISQEIDSLINQVVQLGNTSISGKYLFAGFKANVAPFGRAGNDVTYGGTPTTEDYQRKVEISRGVEVTINVNGESLLGTVTTAAGPPESVSGGSGLIRTLMALKLDLDQGNTAGIRSRLDELKTDLNQVLALQSDIGAITNRLELTHQRIKERQTTFTKQYASIQDVDTAKTISDMNYQQNVFQASLGVSARVLQPSLLNFLR